MRIPSGVTDQYIYFVAVDSTDFTSRETGLSSFTVYRSRNGGAAAAMTTPTINETDATNMPGVYELLLDEDMTIGAGNDTEEMVFHITATGMAPVTRTIELYRPKITAGNTLGVASDGDLLEANTLTGHTAQTGDSYAQLPTNFSDLSITATTGRVDVASIEGSDATDQIRDAVVDDATRIDASALNTASTAIGTDGTGLTEAGGTGDHLTAITVAALATDSITAAAMANNAIDAGVMATSAIDEIADDVLGRLTNQRDLVVGAAATAGTNTITLNASAEATDDFYNGQIIHISANGGNGQSRRIMDYTGTTKVATVDRNWVTNIASNAVYSIFVQGAIVPIVAADVNAEVVDVLTVDTLADSYASDGSQPTMGQAILAIQQFLQERAVSGTTVTVKKPDGSTTAMTFTLDSGTSPTSITRAT